VKRNPKQQKTNQVTISLSMNQIQNGPISQIESDFSKKLVRSERRLVSNLSNSQVEATETVAHHSNCGKPQPRPEVSTAPSRICSREYGQQLF
jgi:hypothetical protein